MSSPIVHQNSVIMPQLSSPLVDIDDTGRTSGRPSIPWYRWIIAMWNRTGKSVGPASGTVQLVAGSSAIVFANLNFLPRLSDSYQITLSCSAGETLSWSAKTAAGFTITSSNGASAAFVDWTANAGG